MKHYWCWCFWKRLDTVELIERHSLKKEVQLPIHVQDAAVDGPDVVAVVVVEQLQQPPVEEPAGHPVKQQLYEQTAKDFQEKQWQSSTVLSTETVVTTVVVVDADDSFVAVASCFQNFLLTMSEWMMSLVLRKMNYYYCYFQQNWKRYAVDAEAVAVIVDVVSAVAAEG